MIKLSLELVSISSARKLYLYAQHSITGRKQRIGFDTMKGSPHTRQDAVKRSIPSAI